MLKSPRGRPARKLPQHATAGEVAAGKIGLEVIIDDRTAAINLPNPDKVITSREIFFMINRSGIPNRATKEHMPDVKK